MMATPYYDRDGITIWHGDCRDVLPQLPPPDLVAADPPYGMGKAAWDTLIPPSEWLPLARTLAHTVAVFCGVRGLFDYPKTDWTMAWHRPASTQRNGRFRGFNHWEPILIYGADRIPLDVISCPNFPDPAAANHPTSKPTTLMVALIKCLAPQTIVDPFMGSGTTLLAAKKMGRQAVGVEIEERYCEIAANRLAQGVFDFQGVD